MTSIVQDWVTKLPLRYQGVLVAAVRGCDSSPKEGNAKPITRAIRGAFMNPADPREVDMPRAFFSSRLTEEEIKDFLSDWDHYPIHFVQHLMHACQVLGYSHPDSLHRVMFATCYHRIVRKLHLNPETPQEMHARLTEDRLAKYGNAEGEPV